MENGKRRREKGEGRREMSAEKGRNRTRYQFGRLQVMATALRD